VDVGGIERETHAASIDGVEAVEAGVAEIVAEPLSGLSLSRVDRAVCRHCIESIMGAPRAPTTARVIRNWLLKAGDRTMSSPLD